jgi:transposase
VQKVFKLAVGSQKRNFYLNYIRCQKIHKSFDSELKLILLTDKFILNDKSPNIFHVNIYGSWRIIAAVMLEYINFQITHSSMQFRNACILLNSDEGEQGQKVSNEQIAQLLQVNQKTVERLKQRFVEDGFEACMDRKAYPVVKDVKTDGDFEAHLVAISCSKAPEGYTQWSLRMLADKMVELKYVDDVSYETVRQVLKKTKLSPGK